MAVERLSAVTNGYSPDDPAQERQFLRADGAALDAEIRDLNDLAAAVELARNQAKSSGLSAVLDKMTVFLIRQGARAPAHLPHDMR
jgi:hypothetical protein